MPGELVLMRHGATEWSDAGRHTGRTDVPLTPAGEVAARALAPLLAGRSFGLVLCSPLQRARRTAELAGLASVVDDDLVEWDYGGYEGRTTDEIRAELGPHWSVWRDGVVPGDTAGETLTAVAARTARVIERCLPVLAGGADVALAAHGHVLRVLAATWLDLPPTIAATLVLSAGSLSVLGHEHEWRAIRSWNNVPARVASPQPEESRLR